MVKLTFIGHASFLIESDKHKILIDPFINGNPVAKVKIEDLKADAIILTHGHGDHLGDAITIAKNNNSLIVAPFELATYCSQKGVNTHAMHIGGSHNFDFGWVKLVPALHGSGFIEGNNIIYLGNPAGVLLKIDGKLIYHAGDTGLTKDMELIGELYKIDVALLPIGDNFTMGIDDAVVATKMIKPNIVIPMHYNTWPLIAQDPNKFTEKVSNISKCIILEPGQSYSL